MDVTTDAAAQSKANLIRNAFLKLLPVQIIGIVVASVNGFIDSVITGQLLGTETLAAVGYFGPLGMIIGVSYVIISGMQILCGNYIGSGERDKLLSLFSTGTVFLAASGLLFSLLCWFGRSDIAVWLGARGNTALILSDYIAGYSVGITGQVLCGLMMCFLPFNSDIKLSYIAIALMTILNIVLDLAFILVFHAGSFGLGLASALSYLLTAALMLRSFLDKSKAISIGLGDLRFGQLGNVVRLGLPSLMFSLGLTAKSYIMNMTLMANVGDAAVATMNVQGTVCGILGAVPQGCQNAFIALASLYYGDDDRFSFRSVAKLSLKRGVLLTLLTMAALMACSSVIPNLFFHVPAPDDPATELAWETSRRMLLLFPSFLVFNVIMSILLKSYQVQGQMKLVNVLTMGENLLMAVLAAIGTPIIGSDAVWLSFPLADILCLIVIAVSVFIHAGGITMEFEDWLKLSPAFGLGYPSMLERSVSSMDDVVNVYEEIIDFCERFGVDGEKARLAGLCVEEMAGNVVRYGFKPGERHNANIRITVKDELIVRIQDDCPEFNPKKRLDQFSPEPDPTKNIGIRLISRIAKEMEYQNNAGINTVIIKL